MSSYPTNMTIGIYSYQHSSCFPTSSWSLSRIDYFLNEPRPALEFQYNVSESYDQSIDILLSDKNCYYLSNLSSTLL